MTEKSLGRVGWDALCDTLGSEHNDRLWELLKESPSQTGVAWDVAWDTAAHAIINECERRRAPPSIERLETRESIDIMAITRQLSGR
jgi:hypothetical protein